MKLAFTNEKINRRAGILKKMDFIENLKRNKEDQGDSLDFKKVISESETVPLTQQ